MRGIKAQTSEDFVRHLCGVRGVVHAVGVVVGGGGVVAGSFGVDPGDARQLFERGVSAQRGAEARGDASVRAEHAVAKGSHRAARQGGRVGGDVAEDVAEEDFLRERRSGEGGVANLEEGERESHEEVAGGEREGVRLGPDSGGVPVGVRARVVGALTGRVRQLGEDREREVEVAKYLPRERATPRGHGREEREGAVVPDAYPAREVRVDRAHAALEHRARQAVELEVDESLRRGRVRGQATQHVREEAQQGDAHLLRVVQMVRVPQRQDVREPGGHLEVRLRESGRRETARGGRSVKIGVREVRARERGGGIREGCHLARLRRRRRRSGVPCLEPSRPTPGPRGIREAPCVSRTTPKPPPAGRPHRRSAATRSRGGRPRGPPARRASPPHPSRATN